MHGWTKFLMLLNYVTGSGKGAATSLSPIPQHLFDVAPHSTPTSSIYTPTPVSTDDSNDSESVGEHVPRNGLPQNSGYDPQLTEINPQVHKLLVYTKLLNSHLNQGACFYGI